MPTVPTPTPDEYERGFGPDSSLAERCWAVLDALRETPGASLPHLLWLHDVPLEQVHDQESAWRQRARYSGPPLLPPP